MGANSLYSSRKALGLCVECGVGRPSGGNRSARCDACIERIRRQEGERVARIRSRLDGLRPGDPPAFTPTPVYDGSGKLLGWRVWDQVSSLSGHWPRGGGTFRWEPR